MTIRAVLARPRGGNPDQFEGVYLHNAGGPGELGPLLWSLMRDRYRFDAAGFSREMIDDNLEGWSNIDCLGGELAKTWDGKTKISVPEHQENFNEDRDDPGPTTYKGDPARALPGITAPPITDVSDNWGAAFVYVVGPEGLRILMARSPDTYKDVSFAPWKTEEPDWDAIEEALAEEDDEAEAESPEASVLARAYAQSQKGDMAGARATIIAYAQQGGVMTPDVVSNLVYYFIHDATAQAAERAALAGDVLALIQSNPAYVTNALIENASTLLNNEGRPADVLGLFETALAAEPDLGTNCYVAMTYAALRSLDRALMERAVAHAEKALAGAADVFDEDPAVLDNVGSIYVALGKKKEALEYVKRCKDLEYENFAEMATMDDYAAIKDDPEFRALFE